MAKITLKGKPFETNGELPAVGQQAPDFRLADADLNDVTLATYEGKRKILNIVPSLDTPVCQTQTRTFNTKLRTVFRPKEKSSRQILRNLGTLMFAEVTDAMDPGLEVRPTASLELAVFKTDADLPAIDFTALEALDEEMISVRQRVLEVGTRA